MLPRVFKVVFANQTAEEAGREERSAAESFIESLDEPLGCDDVEEMTPTDEALVAETLRRIVGDNLGRDAA